MRPRLKPLEDQIVVITGATSGIGLVTARQAAAYGARVVLAARNGDALERLVREIRTEGGEAVHVVADVAREEDVERIADTAIRHFGGFDTWINNAAVSIYGYLTEVETRDMRRLFDTNFWGVVYGSRAAIRHFRERGGPGKLINMGSVLGERAIPIQGIYAASKHAIAGFTEALRVDTQAEGLPVSITLIKPSAIDTPYKDHAKNYMDEAPQNPPPVYEPEVVAEAVLHAAGHDVRELVVGGGGRLINLLADWMPRTTDRAMAWLAPWLQRGGEPAGPIRRNNLYEPGEGLSERSDYPFTLKRSVYTKAQMHPMTTAAILLGVGAAAVALTWAARRT